MWLTVQVKTPFSSLALWFWAIKLLDGLYLIILFFNVLGGIADTVAKWVFKQGFSPLVLDLAQHRNNADSTKESMETHTNISLKEPEADAGLETILGKKITWFFEF